MRLYIIVIGLLLTVIVAGCASPKQPHPNDPTNVANVTNLTVTSTVDYGNGVYYFPTISAEFGNSLSAFITNHPELELVTITGDGTERGGGHGYGSGCDKGYWVIFRQKSK